MSSRRNVRREGLGDPLEMGAERKRSLQWVVYYRAGGETEGLDLQSGYLLPWLEWPLENLLIKHDYKIKPCH